MKCHGKQVMPGDILTPVPMDIPLENSCPEQGRGEDTQGEEPQGEEVQGEESGGEETVDNSSDLLKKLLTSTSTDQVKTSDNANKDGESAPEKSKSQLFSEKLCEEGESSLTSHSVNGDRAGKGNQQAQGGCDKPVEINGQGSQTSVPLSVSHRRLLTEMLTKNWKAVTPRNGNSLYGNWKENSNLKLVHALLKQSAGRSAPVVAPMPGYTEDQAGPGEGLPLKTGKGSESSASVMKRSWAAAENWRAGPEVWNLAQNGVMGESIDFNMAGSVQGRRSGVQDNCTAVSQECNGTMDVSSPLNKKAKYETLKTSSGTDDSGVFCGTMNKKPCGQLDLTSSDVSSGGSSERQQHGKWKRFVRTAEALQKSGLMDVTMKTAELIKQNTLIQREIVMLQKETSDLVRNILNNTDNSKVLQALHDLMRLKSKSAGK